MTDSEPKALGGLNAATVGWLTSGNSGVAVGLCTHLISKHHYALLRNPTEFPQAALILDASKSGIVLLPAEALQEETLESQLEAWGSSGEGPLKKWKDVTLLYLHSGELADFKASETKKFLGKTTRAAAYNIETGSVNGGVPEVLSGITLSDLDPSPEALFQIIQQRGLEMQNFFERLNAQKSWGTYLMIALCVTTFAWCTAAGGSENLWNLLRFGANFRPLTIDAGQWWRLLGSAFLHIGAVHLLVNMYSLKVVGEMLEKFMGTTRFLTLYCVAAACGSVASAGTGESSISAGASGAIFGLLGACLALGYRYKAEIPKPVRQSMISGMMPALGYNLIFGLTVPGIDNAAHLGGLLAGFITAWVTPPRIAKERLAKPLEALFAFVTGVLIATQPFALYQAHLGLRVEQLPQRVYSFGPWTVELPLLFEHSEPAGVFRGPGRMVVCSNLQWPNDAGPANSESIRLMLNRDSKINFEPDGNQTIGARDWFFLINREGDLRRFAVTVEQSEILLLGVVAPSKSEEQATELLTNFLSKARYTLTTSKPFTPED